MAGFNGTGTFVRSFTWVTDKANSVAVTATRFDTEDDGFATGLSTCICKDGQTTVTARIPFSLGIGLGTGTVALPALNFTSDTNTGVYAIGADNLGIACGGTKVLDIVAGAITVVGDIGCTGTLGVSGNFGVTGTFSSTGNATLHGSATVIGAFTAGGASSFSSTLGITGNVTMGGTVTITGGTVLSAGFSAAGASSFGSTLAVADVLTASSALNVTGILNANAAANMNAAVQFSGITTFPGIATSASAANAVFTGGSNALAKSTSSARYKTGIRDIDLQEALRIVHGARPIKYLSLAKADDPTREHLGLVAEELAEVDPRLIHFDGDGRPDGVQYERVVIALLSAVKVLSERAGL